LAAGHIFKTNSDTESILHAYEEWGEACLEHLNGMFAFAIWDKRTAKLFIARDRTGIKPLYYADLAEGLLFASELKSLLQWPSLPRELDYFALDEYLSFEYVPAPRTIFKHVKKLSPGHALTYQAGQLRLWQYWDMRLEASETRRDTPSFEQLAVEFRSVLKNVVQQEMLSDVPLGVFLSGGLDSSAVTLMMKELNVGVVKSFSITFEDASFDEAYYARMVAKYLGTEHHEMTLTSKIVADLIPRVGRYMDEPLADSSLVPTMLLSEFARRQVTVAIGGDGGDEVLGGYSTLQAHRLMAMYASVVPSPLRLAIQNAMNALPTSFNNISLDFKLKRFANGHKYPLEMRHQTWLGSFNSEEKESILQRHLLRHPKATYEVVIGHLEKTPAQQMLNRILYLDMKMYLEGDILPKVDRASMSHSLEVRVPFLNLDMLNFMQAVPIDYKLQRLTTKALLRKALQNDLPSEILSRGKKGFNMPVAKWLAEDLRDWAQDLLATDRLQRQGIFNPKSVQRLLQDHLERRRDARKHLWTLLMF